MFFFPLTNLFILIFLGLLGFLILLVEVKAISYAYERAGVSPRYIFLVLAASLLGSAVNIPLMRLGAGEPVLVGQVVKHFGMEYVIPVVRHAPGTLLAVNVGGALVPTAVSVYLLWRLPALLPKALIGVAVMSGLIHLMADPVPGMGVAVPTLAPPLLAATTALILDRDQAAPLAYTSGTLGVLIGADLLNLGVIGKLGAPVASIGGAGTFDGVFLTGLLAVLLACGFGPGCRRPRQEEPPPPEG